ncbi:hypothetical protein Kpho02_21840 [Kitasatospora phosalacinea]|uniref:DUF4291 domain-containing protein n=1 Tax=Kitasatospora phosalacinea TaxID=2065 RepID=A0A9W6Q4A9_9ACTN|nr:DUF4291 domain-containing protein [Kitasatospora phosalacinea]GLW69885.1 hypothetical protein Kpho02_21840 [Kitasatospora phosalacinea]
MEETPKRQVRARYDDETVTVYQAFRPEIAEPAAAEGRFPAAFSTERMTWVKPSFRWLMHRSDWARSEGQERVLGVVIRREGFDAALEAAVLSSYERGVHASRAQWQRELRRSAARVQWDPERDLGLQPLAHRSLQLGLGGELVRRYAGEWLVRIEDLTPLARALHASRDAALLPPERPYPVPAGAAARLGVS